jgi:hypothetical protein
MFDHVKFGVSDYAATAMRPHGQNLKIACPKPKVSS